MADAKKGLLMLLGGGDEKAEKKAEHTDEQRDALKAFWDAQKEGDVEAGLDAFKLLCMCCEDEEEGEEY